MQCYVACIHAMWCLNDCLHVHTMCYDWPARVVRVVVERGPEPLCVHCLGTSIVY